MNMRPEEIDCLITGGRISIENCFAVGGLIYYCAPDRNEVTWVSEHDEGLHAEMEHRLLELRQSYKTKEELLVVLQHHPTLANHVELIAKYV
jgi:hypothetical protein